MIDLAVVSGSGFYDFPGLKNNQDQTIETKFGEALVQTGTVQGRHIAFIARHRQGHSLMPKMINYRADLPALKILKVKALVSTTVCGVLDPSLPLGQLAVFRDIFFPGNRLPGCEACTVYDRAGEKERGHFMFDFPFSEDLRRPLIRAADPPPLSDATYTRANGPRFNSRAEIRHLRNCASFVSQTAGPEIVLAGELEIPAALARAVLGKPS